MGELTHEEFILKTICDSGKITHQSVKVTREGKYSFSVEGIGIKFGYRRSVRVDDKYYHLIEPTPDLVSRIETNKDRLKYTQHIGNCDLSGVSVDKLKEVWSIIRPL